MAIRILVADGHEWARRDIREHLEGEPGIEVVAEVATGREAVAQAAASHPDVVLLDVHMPSGDGLWAIAELAREVPGVRVLILTVSGEAEHLPEGLRCGAAGFVLKGGSAEALVHAIHGAACGGWVVAGSVAGWAAPSLDPPAEGRAAAVAAGLSPREREVLHVLARGGSNRDIGVALQISENTVKAHLKAVLRKLGLHNRVEAAGWALRHLAGGIDD